MLHSKLKNMSTLPYIVSICSYNAYQKQGMTRYLQSLSSNVKSPYELILFGYAPHEVTPFVLADNVRMYNSNEPYPGNLHRFDALYALSEHEMDHYRWMIFTDAVDVVFQIDLPNLNNYETHRDTVYVASEGETWSESSWFPVLQEQVGVPFIDAMHDKMILNAGSWCMRVETFRKMYEYMIKRSKDYGDHPWSDQPIYNEFMYSGDIVPTIHPSLFLTLYKNIELGNALKVNNQFCNTKGELFNIVHGNGSSKVLLEEGNTND